MTTFDDRENAFERKFAHDEELQFRAKARRDKLLGLWAAEKLGLAGAEAEAYARAVVEADIQSPRGQGAFRKLRADFDTKGVQQSDHQIQRRMEELMEQAITQIRSEVR